MCRMVGVVSNPPISHSLIDNIWENIKKMANDQTVIHENNSDSPGDYKHQHGWGVAFVKDGKIGYQHSETSIYDDNIDQIRSDLHSSTAFIIHARKASPNIPVGFDYLHPFIRKSKNYGNLAFSHNGTITNSSDIKTPNDYPLITKSDTEKYLNFLLNEIDKNSDDNLLDNYIRGIRLFKQKAKYSGINSFMLIDNQFFVLNEFTKTPKYLTMYFSILEDKKAIIVSSEKIKNLNIQWTEIGSGNLISIPLNSQFNYSKIKI